MSSAALTPPAQHAGPRPWPRRHSPRGFTLVELVMAMLVMAVLAATLVVFFKPALDGYNSGRERNRLLAEIDHAVQRMQQDVRSAVPNSIRSPNAQCFELVPTLTGGRARIADNTVDGGAAYVRDDTSTSQFDVLNTLSALPAVGDWLVVENQNPADVYSGSNRSAITALATPAAAHGQHRISINPLQFPPGYSSGRFVVVPDAQQAVFYVCSGASSTLNGSGHAPGTLVRLKRYGFNAAAPGACPATTGGDVLAENVRSCRFLYDPNQGATQQSGFLAIQLELTRSHQTASLVLGAHVSNVP